MYRNDVIESSYSWKEMQGFEKFVKKSVMERQKLSQKGQTGE